MSEGLINAQLRVMRMVTLAMDSAEGTDVASQLRAEGDGLSERDLQEMISCLVALLTLYNKALGTALGIDATTAWQAIAMQLTATLPTPAHPGPARQEEER